MSKPQRGAGPLRLDLQLIADMIEPETRVLDVGCGDGALLAYLGHAKGVDGRGIELSQAGVNACVSHGLSVIQGDADTDLKDYPRHSFDYAVLSQTLPAMGDPKGVLLDLVRIGRHAIVSIANFGYWRLRLSLLSGGRTTIPNGASHRWYDTPNIHPCTIADFTGGPYYRGKLVTGPDGDMWFATADAQNLDQWSIDKISETGQISSYPLPDSLQPWPCCSAGVQDLAVGPDGDIWFTDPLDNTIGKIETSGNDLTDYHIIPTPTGTLPNPGWIFSGPDGKMWFTFDALSDGGQLATITTSGIYQLLLSSPAGFDEPVPGADGNVWVTSPMVAGDYGGKYAQVVRITSSGEVTQYPLPANSVHNIGDAIAAGPDGDIWVAGVYSIYKIRTSAAPGGPPPPVLSQPVARQSDPLLMRQLPVQATTATTSVEYGWAATASAGAPDLSLSGQAAYQTCTDLQACWLDYRAAQPDQTWYLFARSVDASGDWGPWSPPLAIKTPGKPLVIALGDSITSGHHKDSNTSLTVCDDPAYSYAAGVFANTNSFLPTTWQRSGYTNLAHSGFSTDQIISGGQNACGTNVPSSPLTAAEKLLRTNAGSWNRLVMSADVDNTNWNSVIARIILNDRLPGSYTASSCRQDMAEWDGTNRSVIAGIKRSDLQIVNGLEATDPTVTIDWLDYYQIAGTGTDKVSTRPVMPAVCTQAVQTALTYLNVDDIQQATQGKGVVLVNTNALIDGQDNYLQGFYPSDYIAIHKLPGWPHPNEEGQAKIAAAIGP